MAISASQRPRILLVHGAWHGAWCWQILEEKLTEQGWSVTSIDLPSVAAKGKPRFGMHDDAKAIRTSLEGLDGPTIVVAHSYGGIPVTEGASNAPNVVHLVYLAAFQLDVNESLLDLTGGEPPAWTYVDGDVVTVNTSRDIFFGDVEEDVAEDVVPKLLPHSLSAQQEKLTTAAWRTIPSTYVICELDNAIPVAAQESMATRARHVVRLAASHSPFLSRPDDVIRIIRSAAEIGLSDELPCNPVRGTSVS
ncbi:alpha/beta hydrolase [Rhodococcus wratislaviensis]|uniref:alpha/beta hydrolase n=1 Tax=Rhodococcus wratislaviensis TaxID=44752 RepID=UPI003655DCF2